MKAPLLTIGIPTFERVARLRYCLESILAQRKGSVAAEVEIVVSDNNSTDGTWPLLQDYARSHGVRVRRNAENIGMDLNLIEVNRMATGDFIWWMGDDDQIHEGFLAYACELLRSAQSDFYFVPCAPISGRPECRGTVHYLGFDRPVTAPLWDIVNEHGFFRILGSLGHCMFRRERLLDYAHAVPHSTCFSHAFALLFSFRHLSATLLTRSGFEVPEKSHVEMNQYVARWKDDHLWNWGWFRSAQMLHEMVAGGHLPFPKPTFFQMFAGQDWAFQFHAIQSLLKLAFEDGVVVASEELQKLGELTRWLNQPAYDALCRKACDMVTAQNEMRTMAKQISRAPIAAFAPRRMECVWLRA